VRVFGSLSVLARKCTVTMWLIADVLSSDS
jgi:hypothetical protein